jgi:5-methyltetrahydrofolate--homocysteine methyltransferase
VIGVLGPTSRTAVAQSRREQPRLPRDQLRRTGRGLSRGRAGLIDGGADVLMVETIFDTLNAKAALFAIDDVFERTRRTPAGDDLRHHHRRSGRTSPGQTAEAFWYSVRHASRSRSA